MNILSNEQISGLPTWLPVRDFPKYEVNCREGLVRNVKTLRVLKPHTNRYGYPRVRLYNGKNYTKTVHRIVALTAFSYYGISSEGLFVLHLDETRTNSVIDNLALGSQCENLAFPEYKERISEAKSGEKHPNFGKHRSAETRKKISDAHPKKAVGAFKEGRLILKFESISDAGRNGFNQSIISQCCLGRRKNHKGYEWKYLTA